MSEMTSDDLTLLREYWEINLTDIAFLIQIIPTWE
jgi:hypothetical protein